MPRSAKSPALPGVVAVLAVALALSVPSFSAATAAPVSAAPTGATTAPTAPTTPARHFTRAQATRIFQRLQQALKPKHAAPRKLGDPLPRRDLSLLMRDAQLAKSSMSARQASIIDSSSRPVPDSQGCTDYTPLGLFQAKWVALASTHFCVHYRRTLAASSGGATDAQAQTTLDTMEYVYAKEVSSLDYQAPLADDDGLVDVFLDQLGDQGYYGFCTNDDPTPTSTAWCGLDNDFAVSEFGAPPLNSLRVTAAHEFFHAIQFAYNDDQNSWFMEGTAVWMEDIVYPAINDYLQYLPLSQVVRPRQSTDYEGRLERYGAVTFFKYLSERFRDNGIIRQIWGAAVPATGRDGIQAVIAVLRARGYSFAPEFARYGVWNTLPPGSYGDRALWPSRGVWASTTLTKRRRDTGLRSVALNHLANAPLVARPGSSLPRRAKLRVLVDAPSSSHGSRASVEVRFKNGTVKNYTITLNGAGNGSKRFGFNRRYVKSAIVVLTNASVGYNHQTFKVRAKAVF